MWKKSKSLELHRYLVDFFIYENLDMARNIFYNIYFTIYIFVSQKFYKRTHYSLVFFSAIIKCDSLNLKYLFCYIWSLFIVMLLLNITYVIIMYIKLYNKNAILNKIWKQIMSVEWEREGVRRVGNFLLSNFGHCGRILTSTKILNLWGKNMMKGKRKEGKKRRKKGQREKKSTWGRIKTKSYISMVQKMYFHSSYFHSLTKGTISPCDLVSKVLADITACRDK